ncbi:MFS transporter [Saccharothrix stipae]
MFMSRYLPTVAENAVGRDGRLHVLGIAIAPGSLFTYTVSACSVALVVVMPAVGALADRTGRHRALLAGFAFLGAALCGGMWFVGPTDWRLGTALYATAYIGYSCSIVLYNSMLAGLADLGGRDRVSSVGWAVGYLGGGVLLAVNLASSFVLTDRALLARASLAGAGLWWAVFAAIALWLLRGYESPPRGSAATSLAQLVGTLREARRYPVTLLLLAAILLYFDGIHTVTLVAADYGEKELRLSDQTLLNGILMIHFVAFAGALALGRLAYRWGAKRVVLGSLVVWLAIILAMYLVQPGRAWQFYAVAFVVALVLGGSQALSRSLFSKMVPRGREAGYFSLYEISNSGMSALGPLLFGIALQNTGSYRSALVSLVVFFVLGFILLTSVDVRRGVVMSGNGPEGRPP